MITKTDLTKEQIIEIIEEEYIKLDEFSDILTGKEQEEATECRNLLGSILYRIEHGETVE